MKFAMVSPLFEPISTYTISQCKAKEYKTNSNILNIPLHNISKKQEEKTFFFFRRSVMNDKSTKVQSDAHVTINDLTKRLKGIAALTIRLAWGCPYQKIRVPTSMEMRKSTAYQEGFTNIYSMKGETYRDYMQDARESTTAHLNITKNNNKIISTSTDGHFWKIYVIKGTRSRLLELLSDHPRYELIVWLAQLRHAREKEI
jgi:hypothetical protein